LQWDGQSDDGDRGRRRRRRRARATARRQAVAVGRSYTTTGGYSQDLFALVRYNANGSLDAGFGSGGKVTTAIGNYDDANAVVLEPDGKLVAAGITHGGSDWNFGLARYNPNGSL